MNTKSYTLLMRCPDDRNEPGFALGTIDYASLNLLETPGIAATPPPNLGMLYENYNIARVMVWVHTVLPNLKGCAGLNHLQEARNQHPSMEKRMAQWLQDHLLDPDPMIQLLHVRQQLMWETPDEIEILACIFDHVAQQIYPVGRRWPFQSWEWVDIRHWRQITPLGGTIPLDLDGISAELQMLLDRNLNASDSAASGGLLNGYPKSESFNTLVLNGSPYPPAAYPKLRPFLGISDTPNPHPYFSVYFPPGDPHWGMDQLIYALEKCPLNANIIIIAGNIENRRELHDALAGNEAFQRLNESGWTGKFDALVLQQPY
jgi:hypothetical protein